MTLPKEKMLWIYEKMIEIRFFEERVIKDFASGQMPGFVHCYVGEEAVAAGVCAALNNEDWITSTHRGHGHIIAKGGELSLIMAELYGRETGYCHGKGGSMHVAELSLGILGANGIVGGGIPIAGGAALTAAMTGSKQVAVSFFGDGASDEGSFHESLNLAALWNLPVIFVCENNLYADFAVQHRHQKIVDISGRAGSYVMAGVTIDGNDAVAVHQAAMEAVERARSGKGPTLLECKTYRWRGHYEGDPAPYRTAEEVEEKKKEDPIPRFEAFLLEQGLASETYFTDVRSSVLKRLDEAVEFALNSPFPSESEALKNVYTNIEVEEV
ncbi:MAG: thiamine pyrophosphate-dependent dehydrogenase E1 component subunit alpha [Eubacteriales bacterium]